MKKVLARIGTLLLVMAMTLAIIPGAAFAADNTPGQNNNTLTLYKYDGYNGTSNAGTTHNDGTQQTIPDSYTALSGIVFDVYKTDISLADYTGEDNLPTSVQAGWTKVATLTTDANGYAQKTGLVDGIYYVVEQPSASVSTSENFYVSLPYTYPEGYTINNVDVGGQPNYNVFAYPKNSAAEHTIDVTKTSTAGTNAIYEVAAAGETINWTSTFALDAENITTKPWQNIGSLVITDTQDTNAFSAATNFVVKLGTDTLAEGTTGDYTVTNNTAAGYTITFTDAGLAKIKALTAAPTVTVTYDSDLTSTAASGTAYKNTISAEYYNTVTKKTVTDTDVSLITTGSITVTKYDEKAKATALPGVKFQLYDSTGAAIGSPVETDTNGQITWNGLGDGTYKVKEVATVPGYTLNQTETVLTINGTTTTLTDTDHVILSFTQKNYLLPNLPFTGGTGIALLAGTGILLIGGAIFLLKKKSHVA